MANTFKVDTKSSCVTDAHTSTNANVLSAGGSATLVLLTFAFYLLISILIKAFKISDIKLNY